MPILSKPYVITDAGRQSEDIDRMFDDVYTEIAELEREQAESLGGGGGEGARGVPGEDGDDSDAGLWGLPVTRSSTSLVDTTNLARLNAVQSFTAANTWTATGNNFDEMLAVDKGLQFPATQVADAGANVLDDCEKGNWSPVLGGDGGTSGQTYGVQVGRYAKLGQLVCASGAMELTAKGTITGNVEFQGLPFTSLTDANAFAVGTIGRHGLATAFVDLVCTLSANSTAVSIRAKTAAATAPSLLSTTDIGDTSFVYFTIMYRASA